MDHDDDVEHLFSWLQTPELRYREFAGAREITDAVVVVQQQRANSAAVPADAPVKPSPDDVQLHEEYPENQFPDQDETRVEILPEPEPEPVMRAQAGGTARNGASPALREETKMIAREEAKLAAWEQGNGVAREPAAVTPAPPPADPFALGASGRGIPRRPHFEEPVVPPAIVQAPAPRQAAVPTPPPPPIAPPAPRPMQSAPPPKQPVPSPPLPPIAPPAPRPMQSAPPPQPAVAPAGGGLLGGAYRGANGHDAGPAGADDRNQRNGRSLDAVFGRLAGTRNRLPDPRERRRSLPGLGSPTNRTR